MTKSHRKRRRGRSVLVKTNDFQKKQKKLKKTLDFCVFIVYNIKCSTREWRNRQTRTFEGRVSLMYGFKSRFPHQDKDQVQLGLYFFPRVVGLFPDRKRDQTFATASVFALKTIINRFLHARHFPHKIKNCRLIRVVSTYCFLFIVKKCLKVLANQELFALVVHFCICCAYMLCHGCPKMQKSTTPHQGVVPFYR